MFACDLFLIDGSNMADTLQTQPGIVGREDHNALLSPSLWKGNLYHLTVTEFIPALYAAFPTMLSLMPLQSLPPQWELDRERERGSAGWTSPGLIQIEWEGFPLYWLGGLWWQSNSAFFGSSGSLPVISAEGRRVLLAAAIPIIYTAPMRKVAGPQLAEVALMLLIWKWDVIGLTQVAPFG